MYPGVALHRLVHMNLFFFFPVTWFLSVTLFFVSLIMCWHQSHKDSTQHVISQHDRSIHVTFNISFASLCVYKKQREGGGITLKDLMWERSCHRWCSVVPWQLVHSVSHHVALMQRVCTCVCACVKSSVNHNASKYACGTRRVLPPAPSLQRLWHRRPRTPSCFIFVLRLRQACSGARPVAVCARVHTRRQKAVHHEA